MDVTKAKVGSAALSDVQHAMIAVQQGLQQLPHQFSRVVVPA